MEEVNITPEESAMLLGSGEKDGAASEGAAMDRELIFKIKTFGENWESTKDTIEKISATYSGNCKLRIEVDVDDRSLPICYSE